MSALIRTSLLTVWLFLCAGPPAAHAQHHDAPDLVAIAREAQAVDSTRSYVAALPDRRRACQSIAWPLSRGSGIRDRLQAEAVRQHCLQAMMDQLLTLHYSQSADGTSVALRARAAADAMRTLVDDLVAGSTDCAGAPCAEGERRLIMETAYTESLDNLLTAIVRLNGPRDAKHPDYQPDNWLSDWRAAGGPPRETDAEKQEIRWPLPDDWPQPDYDAVRKAAQRAETARDYVRTLPERLAECDAIAVPYKYSFTTGGSGVAGVVRFACLKGMLEKMAATYHDAESFSPKGMATLLKTFEEVTFQLYDGVFNRHPSCRPRCGSAFLTMPRYRLNQALRDLLVDMAFVELGGGRAWETWIARWEAVESD